MPAALSGSNSCSERPLVSQPSLSSTTRRWRRARGGGRCRGARGRAGRGPGRGCVLGGGGGGGVGRAWRARGRGAGTGGVGSHVGRGGVRWGGVRAPNVLVTGATVVVVR